MAHYSDYLREMQKAAQQSAKKEEAAAKKSGKVRENSYEETVASVKKSLAPKITVDDTFLQQLQTDATSFFENGQKSIKDIGYSAGRRAYDDSVSTIDDLRGRSNSVMSYILENRDGMGEENYRNVRAFIKSLQDGLDGYEKEYKGIQKHFSQWDTEDAYNTAVRQEQWADKYRGKSASELTGLVDSLTDEEEKEWLKGYSESVDYQERMDFDTEAGQKEVEDLARAYAEAEISHREYQDYLNNPFRALTDHAGFQKAQKAVLDTREKYGSLQNMEKAVQEKRQYLGSARETQQNARDAQTHEQWLKTVRAPEQIRPELEQARKRERELTEEESLQKSRFQNAVTSGAAADGNLLADPARSAALAKAREDLQNLEKEYYYGQLKQYNALMNNADFSEKSRYASTQDPEFATMSALMGIHNGDMDYEYINRGRGSGEEQSREDKNLVASMQGRGKQQYLQMTDEEVGIYNYLYATEGKKKAGEYLDFLNSDLNRRQRQADEALTRQRAEENPVAMSALSVGLAPLKAAGFVAQGLDYLGDGQIDQNAAYNTFSNTSTAIRDAVAQKIEQSGNWGKAGSFAYQTAMSMGDFVLNATIAGGSSALSMAIMGSGAAADTTISAKDRGLDDTQAFTLGAVAGIAEALTEMFSVEALLDPNLLTNGIGKYIIKNVIAEGSEEVASSVLNLMADLAISGDRAQFRQSIHKYQQMGYTEGEAFGRAAADQAMSLGMDFLGGAISGGIMGGAYGGGQYLQNRRTGQAMARMIPQESDAMQNILDEGMNSPKDSDAYLVAAQLQEKLDQGKQLTDADRGRLFASNPAVVSEQIQEQGKVELATPTTRGIDNTSEEWQQAKRLSAITGRNIVFFNGGADVNGYFDKPTGKIYVNIDGADTVLQTVSHELTHSTEMAAAYKDLSRFVMGRIAATGGNLEQIRKDKAALYERHGVTLKTQEDVDAEIVAQYVQEHLLTDEETIFQVAVESPSLGQKILNWIDGLLAKMGNKAAKERQVLTQARGLYAKALDQTRTAQDQKQTAGQKESTTQNQAARTMQEQAADDDISDEEYDDLTAIEEEERIREEHAAEGDKRYSFAGEKSRSANMQKLQEAKTMQNKGVANETIRQETGWFQGMDGKWRYEIDDSKMKMSENISNYMHLGDLVKHDSLYESYPDLADVEVVFQSLESGVNGSYHPQFDSINLSYRLMNDPIGLKEALVHEIQHAIQHREGFTSGATAESWERKRKAGFDSRRAADIRKAQETERELRRIQKEEPEFYRDMVELDAMTPDQPRGEIDWETLEQIQEDPIEWQQYDARREELEEKYGDTKVWDMNDLLYQRDQAAKNMGRSGVELYFDTAGEIEARDAANRSGKNAEQRKASPPRLGNEDTVFAEGNTKAYSLRDLDIQKVFIQFGDTKAELQAIDSVVSRIKQSNKAVTIDERNVTSHKKAADWSDRKKARLYLKSLLKQVLGDTVQITYEGNTAYAYLTKDGLNHSAVGMNTPEKAAVFEYYAELIKNAEYAYSSPNDIHSNANMRIGGRIDWDCFVSLGKIGANEIPIVFKIRSTDRDVRSQIYRIATKNEIGSTHDDGLQNEQGALSNYDGTPISEENISHRNGKVNEKFSISESSESQAVGNSHGDNRSGNENIVEDIVRDNARQAGYPVLKGEQIVPFKTWVRAEDRGNYGLVVGMAPENKLVVNFRNKEENLNKTMPMPYDLLTPVPGEYQMTKEEYDSLMHSAPEEAGSHPMTAEEQQEMEDLLNRAGGNTGKKGAEQARKDPPKILDIARDQLPGKARDYLRRAESRMLNAIGDALSIPRYTRYNVLKEIIQGISDEYIRTGTVEQEKLDEFFDKAYSQGIVEDTRFFDQYKDIKETLKTTAVTISPEDQKKVENFADFRKKAFGTLRILNEGGMPVTEMYEKLRQTAPELFPAQLKEPADQLVRMYGVAKSIQRTHMSLDDFHGADAEFFRKVAHNDFQNAVDDVFGDLKQVRKYAEEKDSKPEVKRVLTTEEASKYYADLKAARRDVERVRAKNLLSDGDEMLLGRMLKGEITEAQLNPDTDNIKGIMAVYQATLDYEALNDILREYKRSIRAKRLQTADTLLETATTWKDKKSGFLYARETMRRNILDIVPNRDLAEQIIETYFESIHRSEAASTKFKTEMRDRVRALELSTKVDKGNTVSEAHAVQLLGEALDNIRVMEKSRGRMKQRDGMSYDDWVGVVQNLWAENPNLNKSKIENAVDEFRKIYDELFKRMNQVRVENGYEPVNYRQGYFPHFQPGNGDGIMAYFGKILGIDVQVDALPTTINGLSHTFKPGIQWFGNAQQRIGFNTAYDAVEGFDKYVEGVASVIFQTENIQNLRALATQARYRTSDKGIRDQVDAVRNDDRLTDEEKQAKITDIFENGKFALANFVVELDEYTNLLANKKSRYDRTMEALIGRKAYTMMKTWENQIGANMIAGNISSALTNFIPLTQAGAQLDTGMILKGMWSTLQGMKQDDGIPGMSDFLINRRGSDPLVKTWVQKASGVMGTPMELIDNFTSEAIVRAAYLNNLKHGMPEAEALHQADIFAAGVMADRSKGSMPTLFESRNPVFKAFTQFQLEVNNQVSEVFKDLPRNFRGAAPGEKKKELAVLAAVLLKYFIGAMLYNEVYEALIGRRPAMDPLGILVNAKETWEEEGIGAAGAQLVTETVQSVPFVGGLLGGGRLPVSGALPDLAAVWDAATKEDWGKEKRWKELQDELNKLAYVIPPFGGAQVSKIWKAIDAYAKGGSYSVNNEGKEILQYAVYKDEEPAKAFGRLLKMAVMGKGSLESAQEWAEGGYKSLTAEETAIYQDMHDAGVKDRDAFELIQKVRQVQAPEGTGESEKSAVMKRMKKDLIFGSNVSKEGQAILYYGTTASETEKKWMNSLADAGADQADSLRFVVDLYDAGKLKGQDKKIRYAEIFDAAPLTEEEKQFAVQFILGTDRMSDSGKLTQYGKFLTAMETGLSVDQYMDIYSNEGNMDDFFKMHDAGVKAEAAADITLELAKLEPMPGEEKVSWNQECDVILNSKLSNSDQVAALQAVSYESTGIKIRIGYENGLAPGALVYLKRILPEYDANGNGSYTQKEVKAAIDAVCGDDNVLYALTGTTPHGFNLTNDQKAVLWQLQCNGKKNPYNQAVGDRIYQQWKTASAKDEDEPKEQGSASALTLQLGKK